jgi:hypothetical protein
MRSDARIFASDGNVTMKALAKSPSLFASTCGTLLSRILNTVPRSVTLTEVVEPLPVKPTDYALVVHPNNNTFTFNANVRVSIPVLCSTQQLLIHAGSVLEPACRQ